MSNFQKNEESRQAQRMKSFRMAFLAAIVLMTIQFMFYKFHVYTWIGLWSSLGSVLLGSMIFYILFRTGLNRKFKDPSLTFEQILVSILVLCSSLYFSGKGGEIIGYFFLVLFLFGTFRLTTKKLLFLATLSSVLFGGIEFWKWHNDLDNSEFVYVFLNWFVLSFVMAFFSFVGGFTRLIRQDRQRIQSELMEAVQQSQQAKLDAEQASHVKSDFLANMSHEIRTPMNAIIGLGYLVLKTELTHKQKDYLTKIEKSAQSLLGIINDILDFSKIEAKKMEMEESPFFLDTVMEEVSVVTSPLAAQKGLELIFDHLHDVQFQLIGDQLRLKQIILNLVTNAIKFTEKGNVLVNVEEVERTDQKLLLKFKITDQGIGLTREQCSRLFQSFSQADSSSTRKFGGTGLGLVICQRLSELMGGSIGLDSQFGSGSIFWFTVRLGYNKSEFQASQDQLEMLNGIRVLAVEDNPIAQTILLEILDSLNVHSVIASSGEEAINIAKKYQHKPFDLVLMDYKLPGINGLETISQIKQSLVNSSPAIVMISAYSREEMIESESEVLFDGFLDKPVTPVELLNSMLSVLAKMGTHYIHLEEINNDEEELAVLKNRNILVVEDNKINQQVATELLEQVGLNVTLAENGLDAINFMEKRSGAPFDLVFMDIQMPVMDGYEATRKIKLLPSVQNIPIVAMTAHAMRGDRELCIAAGMDDYLVKPIDVKNLHQILKKWLGVQVVNDENIINHTAYIDINCLQENGSRFDYEDAVSRLGGSRSVYRQIQSTYLEYYLKNINSMEQYLECKNYLELKRFSHSLKAAAATLGDNNVSELSAKIESACRNKYYKNLEELIKQLAIELRLSLDEISSEDEF